MFRTSGKEELEAGAAVHTSLASVQEKTAFLPDYGFKKAEAVPETPEAAEDVPAAWPAVDAGTSVSGLVGGGLTLVLIFLIGLGLRTRSRAAV